MCGKSSCSRYIKTVMSFSEWQLTFLINHKNDLGRSWDFLISTVWFYLFLCLHFQNLCIFSEKSIVFSCDFAWEIRVDLSKIQNMRDWKTFGLRICLIMFVFQILFFLFDVSALHATPAVTVLAVWGRVQVSRQVHLDLTLGRRRSVPSATFL